ncbi:MAG: DNA primase [Pseudomonadota bacterium]
MFNQAILNDIRDRISIVTFVGERIPLKKAGRNFKAPCPFHEEKTPSFIVSDEKQIFHCFGCGEGGDIFKFLMKYEGLNFAEAVLQLAQRAGVVIPEDDFKKGNLPGAEVAQKKKQLFRVNQLAAQYFQRNLQTSAGIVARNYLESRGFKKEENWTQLFLGYAENDWESLVKFLRSQNVPLELASELGLIRQKQNTSGRQNTYYDFFRQRLMFPIISNQGEILGFSGRTLDVENSEAAKYLNSPDSLIYHKANSVYGLNLAQDAIRKKDQVILVEGNIDFVSIYLAGVRNVVAPLGTALTSGHIRLLGRFTKNMVLVFDGDEAGKNAAKRALPLFVEMGFLAKAVALPQAEDPDSFIKKYGVEKLQQLIDNAPTLFEQVVNFTQAHYSSDMAGKIEVMRRMVPVLREVKEPAEKSMYAIFLANKLKVKEEVIQNALKTGLEQQKLPNQKPNRLTKHVAEKNNQAKAQRLLVETMVARPELVDKIFKTLSPEDFTDEWSHLVAKLFYEHRNQEDFNLNDVLTEVADQELATQLRALAMQGCDLEFRDVNQLVEDCLGAIRKCAWDQDIEQMNRQIRLAEDQGNESLVFELLAKKRDLIAEGIVHYDKKDD